MIRPEQKDHLIYLRNHLPLAVYARVDSSQSNDDSQWFYTFEEDKDLLDNSEVVGIYELKGYRHVRVSTPRIQLKEIQGGDNT